MPLLQRVVETVFALKDNFTKDSAKVEQSYTKLSASATKAEKTVNQSSERISAGFGRVAARAGAALGGVGAGLIAGDQFSKFVDQVDRLGKQAQTLNTTTEELSKLVFAAEQSGVAITTLEASLSKLNIRVAEAAQGRGEGANVLKELNLSAQALNELPVEEKLKQIADALLTIEAPGDKARIATKLFGEQGVALLRVLEDGSAGLTRYGLELERIGGVIDSNTAAAAANLNDSLARLNANYDAFVNRIAPPVVNALNSIFDATNLGARTVESVSRQLAEAEKQLKVLQDPSTRGRGFGFGSTKEIEEQQRLISLLRQELGTFNVEVDPQSVNKLQADVQRIQENVTIKIPVQAQPSGAMIAEAEKRGARL